MKFKETEFYVDENGGEIVATDGILYKLFDEQDVVDRLNKDLKTIEFLQARIDGALEKLGDGQQYAHYASQHANTDGKIAMAKLLLKAIEILKGEPAHD